MIDQRDAVDVSVIVPIRNKAKYLAACLDSVLSQEDVSLELICIDDASTDGSAEVAREYVARDGRVRLYCNASHQGAAFSRNVGLARAGGRFIQLTDADDILMAGALQALLEAARANNSDVARGTLRILRNGETFAWPTETITVAKSGAFLSLEELWIPWFHILYLVSRDLIEANGIRYPILIAGEDAVFMARVLTAATRISAIPDVTYLYRQDEPRPQPTRQTVEDYLAHAQMIKRVYTGRFSPCWEKYGPFIAEDIRLLISQADLTEAERALFESRVSQL